MRTLTQRTLLIAIQTLLFCSIAFAESPPLTIPGCINPEVKTFTSSNTPEPIFDHSNYVSVIPVTGVANVIWDIDVRTTVQHSNDSDLRLLVFSPEGTSIALSRNQGSGQFNAPGTGAFNGTLWDDQADNPVGDVAYVASTTVSPITPFTPLAATIGENANGFWSLSVQDTETNNQGEFIDWSITITACTPSPVDVAPVSIFVDQAIPDNSSEGVVSERTFEAGLGPVCGLEIDTFIEHTFPGDLEFFITSPNGISATLSNRNGRSVDSAFYLDGPGGIQGTTWKNDAEDSPASHAFFPGVVATPLSPEESFALFFGDSLSGTWKLTVIDRAFSDTGRLVGWNIRAKACPDITPPTIVCPVNLTDTKGIELTPLFTGEPIAQDEIDSDPEVTYTDFEQASSCPVSKFIVRRWTAVDASGNSSSCEQQITVTDIDANNDGVIDCSDSCPNDPTKTEPGVCGCGSPDTDANGNGVIECEGELGTTDISGQCVPGAGDCYYEPLKKSACVGANGFLGQINIASVINLQATALQVKVKYLNSAGALVDQVSSSIEPNLKSDFIINDLGLLPDSIGTVCIETNAGGDGGWTGGITIYKPDTRTGTSAFGEGFDFAAYYPFLNPTIGMTTTPLNTFHLGTDPSALVANWISIIDATANDGKGVTGELRVFDSTGAVKKVIPVSIPDGGRSDFAGHEALSGVENIDAIGLAQFVSSGNTGYYLTLTRYFYDCPGASCTNFLTAFNIPRRPGSQQVVSASVSTNDGEIAVIELNNLTDTKSLTKVSVFAETGASAGEQTLSVDPKGTTHLIVNTAGSQGFLAANEVGAAKVATQSGSLSALSIFYKLKDGILQYAYAAPFVESPGAAQLSEFNTFIGHTNRTELYNSSSSSIAVTLDFFDFLGQRIYSETLTLKPSESRRLASLPLPVDSYGTFTVQADVSGIAVRNYVSRPGEYTLPYLGN